jgi:hypothetical protein
VSGTTSPLQVTGLSSSTTYTCYVLSYLDGSLASTSSGYSVTTSAAASTTSVYYLIVGGGGGGGSGAGGGGGAGGVVYNSSGADLSSNQTYAIIVGSGGSAGTSSSGSNGSAGQDSKIVGTYLVSTSIIASGGGYGDGLGSISGGSGGCGGGGGTSGAFTTTGGSSTQTSYTGHTVYGTSGGGNAGYKSTPYPGGGGGGAGGSGGSSTSSTQSGSGGAGVAISITGTSTYYAGGGGSSYYSSGGRVGDGGSGIGGNGVYNGTAYSGSVNTGSGGGGGGGGGGTSGYGGNGATGVVILKVPTTYLGQYTGSPIVSTSGSYTILKYISSGTYTNSTSLSNTISNYSFSTLSTSFDTTGVDDWCTYSSYTGQYMYLSNQSTTIYRSSNYGTSWSSTGISYACYGICCSWDGSIVYITGRTGYIYKSTNYGASFTQVKSGLATNIRPICCSYDGVYVYAGSYDSSFYYSTDSGSTWTTSSGTNSTNFIGLSCSYDGKYLIAGRYAGNTVYLNNSTLSNGGGNWTDTGVASSQGNCAISQNGTYMLTNNGTTSWKLSTDGGSTWSTLPSPVNGSNVKCGCAMSYTGQYMIVGYGSTGGIYYSRDYGSSWYLITNSTSYTVSQGTSRTNMSMSASGAYALANNSSKTTYFLMKGYINNYTSMSFKTLTTFDTTGTTDWCTYCSYTGQYIYTCAAATTIYRSSDYGSSWSSTTLSYGMYGICCSWDGSIVYAAGNGYIYKSTDYGVSFTQVKSGLNSNLRPICCSCDGIYVYASSYNSSFYYSTDSGSTWTTSSGTNASNFLLLSCSYDGKYLIGSKYSGNTFYLNNSTLSNAGGAWTDTSITSSSSVAISENGTYMLTNSGSTAWKISKNGGSTWSTLPSPVSGSNILQGCAMSYTGQYMIVGYGSSGGIYYSCDYGNTWGLIPNSTAYTAANGSGSWTNMSMAASGAYAMANNKSKSSYFLMTASTTKLIGSETYYYRFDSADLSTYTMADYSLGWADTNTSSKAGTIAVYSGSTYPYLTSSYYAVGASSLYLSSSAYNYMSIPAFTISSSSSGGYSMSFWANAFSLTTNYYETLFTFNTSGGTSDYGIKLQSAAGSYFSLSSISSGGSSSANISTSYWSMTTYKWNHIALVFSYLSSTTATVYIYINGSLSNSGGTTVYFPWGSTLNYVYIGRQTNYDTKTFWNGCIDDFRIFNGTALTAANVTTLYNYGGTIYSYIAYYKFDKQSGNYVYNYGNSNYDLTLTNSATITTFGGTNVLYLNNSTFTTGTTSKPYAALPTSTLLSSTNSYNAITFSFWVYFLSSTAANEIILYAGSGTGNSSSNITFFAINGSSTSELKYNSTAGDGASSGAGISAGTWYHFAIVILNGKGYTVYKNGSSSISNTTATNSVNQTVSNFIIGAYGSTSWYGDPPINGYYSNFLLYPFALSTSQISSLYSLGYNGTLV